MINNPLENLNLQSKYSSKLKTSEILKDHQGGDEELHKQNVVLLNQFENDVEKVKAAQQRLYEISQLVTTFSEKIIEQDLKTDQSKTCIL